MTREEILERFPNASEGFIHKNLTGGYITERIKLIEDIEQREMGKKRLRQSAKPMNKLEQEFFERLLYYWRRSSTNKKPIAHGLRFQIANGCTYTPDVVSMKWDVDGMPTAWEIKGAHAWDDALVKLKVAASVWPDWRWILVWKTGERRWQSQIIKP